MKFAAIIEKFRALGGVAENIELRTGKFGRGLFPRDPVKPVKIIVPTALLVSPHCLELDADNVIRVKKKSGMSDSVVGFYEDYQLHFGWSNVGISELSAYHRELMQLPQKVKQFLLLFGWLENDFEKKTNKDFLSEYLSSRQIRIENESKLMPFIELINHSPDGKPYVADGGVKFEGKFKNEVLACYHGSFDALHFFRIYHFNSQSTTVLSCDVTINVPNIGPIRISRYDAMVDIKDGVITPRMRKNRSGIQIDFVELVNPKTKLTPRKVFADGLAQMDVSPLLANDIFDGLLDHNREAYANFICECASSPNSIAKELEVIARNQLDLLGGFVPI